MQQIKLADYQNSLRELGCSTELTDTVMQPAAKRRYPKRSTAAAPP